VQAATRSGPPLLSRWDDEQRLRRGHRGCRSAARQALPTQGHARDRSRPVVTISRFRACAQQRLEGRQAVGDLRPVIRRGSERIGPVGDSTEDDIDRRAQQHDSVEAVIDRALIRHAAGDEERACAVAVNERLDLVKVPERLRPTRVWISAIQPGSSVSTMRCPRRLSSASTVDFPLPDMPVTSPATSQFRSQAISPSRLAMGPGRTQSPAPMRHSEMARAGIEPATPRFSVSGAYRSNAAKDPANKRVQRASTEPPMSADSIVFLSTQATAGAPSPIGAVARHDPLTELAEDAHSVRRRWRPRCTGRTSAFRAMRVARTARKEVPH